MACGDDMKTLLSRHVDGELSPEERARVEEHVAACAPCRELLQIFQKNESILSNALSTESFGNTVIESVMSELKREGPPIEASPVDDEATPWTRSRPLLQLAAAALLVIGLVVVLSASHNREMEKLTAKLTSVVENQRAQTDLISRISEDYNRAIASLRVEQAAQGALDRTTILADIAPHHLIVRGVFDLKQFGSFELYRRNEGQGNDAFLKISGNRRLTSPEHIDTSVVPGQAYVYKFRAYRTGGKDSDFVDSLPYTMRVPRAQEPVAERSIRIQCVDIGASFKVAKFLLHRVVDGRNVSEEFCIKPGDRLGEIREVAGIGKVDFRTNLALEKLEDGNQTLTVYYTKAVLDANGRPIIKGWVDGVEEPMTEQKEGVLSIRPGMRACFRTAGAAAADVDVWRGSNLYVRAQD
jgi:hypothetical protein